MQALKKKLNNNEHNAEVYATVSKEIEKVEREIADNRISGQDSRSASAFGL